MGLQQIELGETLQSIAIERYRGAKNRRDIGCILSSKIGACHTHYHENMGYFYCFGGQCCQDLGFPATRYIIPVLLYTRNNNQSFTDYGGPLQLQYIPAGKELYKDDICVKQEVQKANNSDISKQDIIITCSDEAYQKLNLENLGPAKWRLDTEMGNWVKKEYARYKQLIEMSVARNMTPERFAELIEKPVEERNHEQRMPSNAHAKPQPKSLPPQQTQAQNNDTLDLEDSKPQPQVVQSQAQPEPQEVGTSQTQTDGPRAVIAGSDFDDLLENP